MTTTRFMICIEETLPIVTSGLFSTIMTVRHVQMKIVLNPGRNGQSWAYFHEAFGLEHSLQGI